MTFLLQVALMVAATALRGWVLSVMWAWFVVPLGVVPLGVAHAIGLSAVFAALKGVARADVVDDRDRGRDAVTETVVLILSMLASLLFLLVGAVAHAFM